MNVLIFTGGQTPDIDAVSPFFRELIPDYIIAADSGLDAYEKYRKSGLVSKNPDFLIGDFDSVSDRNILDKYDCDRKIYSHDKDYTDSELALMKGREVAGSYGTVILCGGNGGRPDHFMALYDSFSREYHADIWLCGEQVIWFCGCGTTMKIDNVTFEDRISVSRISSEYENTMLDCRGFEWNSLFERGMPSLSNRISKEYCDAQKPIELEAKKGSFLIYTPFTARVSLNSVGED
ncbi:thiamine pyrophosphokinase [Treponema sp.]|uniref:thiamine pyrophosphokinase n=1 Tax=Treponema sp. TaxID=166 RepID=UPI00298E4A48|nr:thiamine pyrophosphokinase [Treponema sp.]MCQ2241455.1 thiamine pyrophosphokinase [Treponema sp.]